MQELVSEITFSIYYPYLLCIMFFLILKANFCMSLTDICKIHIKCFLLKLQQNDVKQSSKLSVALYKINETTSGGLT